eukprot:3197212-Amphidinium_carterae.1
MGVLYASEACEEGAKRKSRVCSLWDKNWRQNPPRMPFQGGLLLWWRRSRAPAQKQWPTRPGRSVFGMPITNASVSRKGALVRICSVFDAVRACFLVNDLILVPFVLAWDVALEGWLYLAGAA